MGKVKYILISLALFMGMSKIDAALCDNSLKVDYQNKAKNISYSYTYNDSNNTFNILFTNVTDTLYLKDMKTLEDYRGNGEITIQNISGGKRYRYGVYINDSNLCNNSIIYNIYITLPFYNPYYNDSLCDGIAHTYCHKFINKSVSHEEFVEILTKYREDLNKEEESIDNNSNDETMLEKILNFLGEFYLSYYYIILPVIIILTILIIIRENKKDNLF